MNHNLETRFFVILIGFLTSVFWLFYMIVNVLDGVMVDGIFVSAVVVTVLAVAFSMISGFLLSWASKNIRLEGILMSVIAGIAIITPVNGVLGPMAAVLVGIGAGAASHVIEKKITKKNLEKKV